MDHHHHQPQTLAQALQQHLGATDDLTEAPEYRTEPTASSETNIDTRPINHPSAFDFPTLSPDGSVDDISTLTPPAALSSLEARATMADQDTISESSATFSDRDYDMIDDRSELSDDHETASLASTERNTSEDGEDTPEDVGSVVEDADEAVEQTKALTNAAELMSFAEFGAEEREALLNTFLTERQAEVGEDEEEEDADADSFLSDDLETPRQSTLPASWARLNSSRRQPSTLSTKAQAPAESLRVLFFSERSLPENEKHAICTKIASSLAGSDDTSDCQISTLPPTPSGVCPSSATIFRDGNLELSVQHCIGVSDQEGPESHSRKYALRILDADPEYSSIYTIGGNRKPDFEPPNLALIYCANLEERSAGLRTAEAAMLYLKLPVMVVSEEKAHRLYGISRRDFEVTALLAKDNQSLQTYLNGLLKRSKCLPKAAAQKPKIAEVAEPVAVEKPTWRQVSNGFNWARYITSAMIALIFVLTMASNIWSGSTSLSETAIRREALASALTKLTNSTDATKTFNIEHLVPKPTPAYTNFLGQQKYDMPWASYYQGALPNHVIVSLTKKPTRMFYPSPKAVRVSKGDRSIGFNQTILMSGIYDIIIDPAEAHGLVDVHMLTKHPRMNFTMQYNFGNRMLQRQTYEKAGTELSKSVNKDLIVAGKAARSLGEMIRLELGAGVAATTNVTTQLVVYMARDLQVFANTAGSLFGKIGQATNNTAAAMRKDLMLAQKDLVAFGKSLQDSVSNTAQSAKDLVPTKKGAVKPLKLSRERAVGFRQKLFGRQKDANSTTATNELSTYLHDFWKPGTTAKKPSKLRDIARCLRARDYPACKKSLETSKPLAAEKPHALSTVPGKGVTSQEPASRKTSARDAKARKDLKRDRALKMADSELKKIAREQEDAAKRTAKQRAKLQKMEEKMKGAPF